MFYTVMFYLVIERNNAFRFPMAMEFSRGL